jgi:hypothetical protein
MAKVPEHIISEKKYGQCAVYEDFVTGFAYSVRNLKNYPICKQG